jgi:hypothetical protein
MLHRALQGSLRAARSREVGVHTGDRGAWAELLVASDLLLLGYQPYRAVSPSAPCDLVADINGTLTRIEVRCVTANMHYTESTTWHTTKAEIGAYVWPSGRIAYSPRISGALFEAIRVNKTGILFKKTF